MTSRVKARHKNFSDNNTSVTLKDLKNAPIWVAWTENDEGRKLPVNPSTGRAAKSDTPGTWGIRKAAQKRAQTFQDERPSGIGVMFTPVSEAGGLRLCGVDLDGCLDGNDLAPWGVCRCGSFQELHRTVPKRNRSPCALPLPRIRYEGIA